MSFTRLHLAIGSVILLSSVSLPPAGAAVPKCGGRRATIVGTARGEVIHGTRGNDVIVAGGGKDVVYGYGGRDVICGGPGADVLVGMGGNDRLFGQAGNDLLLGWGGDDYLNGGRGRYDMVSYFKAPRAVVVDLARGTARGEGSDRIVGVEIVEGSRFGDTLRGDKRANALYGWKGNDVLRGRGGPRPARRAGRL